MRPVTKGSTASYKNAHDGVLDHLSACLTPSDELEDEDDADDE